MTKSKKRQLPEEFEDLWSTFEHATPRKREDCKTDGFIIDPRAQSGATKFDSDKPRPELLPTDVLLSVAHVFAFGAKKYADRNWELGFKWSRLVGGLFRHLFSWTSGERNDPESGRSHLDHALAMLLMLRAHEIRNLGEDDVPL